ncbi:MAG: translation elongation factor 4, partial [Acidobacteria bacterium]|nr:translation elongation factor 4 [Acidobacteriota bacterium]
LAACEGALLVVDASQGVEAQTLANAYMAVENDLHLLSVINKIDLPSAEPDRVAEQIEEIVGLPGEEAILTSAKDGTGIDEILEAIVERIPAPAGDANAPLKAMVFDSWYDPYRGVIVLVRVIDGRLSRGLKVRFMATGKLHDVEEVGRFTPKATPCEELGAGEVGFVIAGIKIVAETRIGDTLTENARPTAEPFPGFLPARQLVFAGLYPIDSADYTDLRDALDKLRLNDSSFTYEPETSTALGFGFRCGFLGRLHMDIIQSRLEREFDMNLIITSPGVSYRVTTKDGKVTEIHSPAALPVQQKIDSIEEPYIEATIVTPPDYVGGVLKSLEERRGTQKELKYLHANRVLITYEMPLNEVVMDLHDRLKSVSKGYASLDYHVAGWWKSDLVKLDLLVNGEAVDALSLIVHREKSFQRGQDLARKMKELIPRQLYEVAIQAALGTKVIARTNVKAMRKNVLAKCYGGDITRKRKLLEKQKKGKKRMKMVGKVEIPQEAFLALLKVD